MTFITDAPTEKTDSQIMQSRIEGTLMSGDYTYVVDGTELATLDNMTVANLRKYNVVIDTAWKEYVSYICGSRTPIARKTKRHAEPGYTRPLYCYKCKTITEFCEEL